MFRALWGSTLLEQAQALAAVEPQAPAQRVLELEALYAISSSIQRHLEAQIINSRSNFKHSFAWTPMIERAPV